MRQLPWNVGRGFLMGAADVVPGVSGGTVALVLGIYPRLVASIRAGSSAIGYLLRGDRARMLDRLRRVEWGFILPLLAGIALAVVALARILEDLLAERPVEMAALFLGLVGGSSVVAWQLLTRRDARRLLIIVGVAIVTFVVLGISDTTAADDAGQLVDPALWAFFGGGAVAICAMILPGVSGSFLLVLLGMYGPVLGVVNDRDVATLAVFLLGAVVGLALFSQILHWALQHHYDSVMAALVGLMAGSVRVLWPWPDGVDSTALGRPDESIIAALVLAVGAFLAVVALHAYATSVASKEPESQPAG